MGVKTDGVHYVATVTWVRTLPAPIDPHLMQQAIDEARRVWSGVNNGHAAASAPVELEPTTGALLVKVALDVTRHDIRPVLHPTRSLTRTGVPGVTAATVEA